MLKNADFLTVNILCACNFGSALLFICIMYIRNDEVGVDIPPPFNLILAKTLPIPSET